MKKFLLAGALAVVGYAMPSFAKDSASSKDCTCAKTPVKHTQRSSMSSDQGVGGSGDMNADTQTTTEVKHKKTMKRRTTDSMATDPSSKSSASSTTTGSDTANTPNTANAPNDPHIPSSDTQSSPSSAGANPSNDSANSQQRKQ